MFTIFTEDQIENRVEKAIDRLDRQLLTGNITQQEYDQEVMIVDKWAYQQIVALRDSQIQFN
jgi:hypothetical protein